MFLKIFQKKISGVAFLPVILLVGGLSVVIIAAIVLVSVETNSSQARTKWATEAFTLSQSGIDDGITKIIRDKNCPDANCPDSYTFSGDNGIVVVTIEKDTPTSGKYTITSCAKVRTVQKQMQAVVSVDPITGQVETESVSESPATSCVSEV